MTVYNRPLYLKKALNSLVNIRHINEWEVFISIDHSVRVEEIFKIIDEFKKYINIRIFYNKIKLGVRNNPLSCLEKAYKEGAKIFLLYEDDIEISNDALEFISLTMNLSDWDKRFSCGNLHLSSCNNKAHLNNNFNHLNEIVLETFFLSSLGLFFSRSQYKEFIKPNWLNNNLIIRSFDGERCEGWDLSLNEKLILSNKPCIQSLVPRVRHFGEEGVHSRDDFYKVSYFHAGLYEGTNQLLKIKVFNAKNIKEQFINLNDWIYIYNVSEQLWRLQKSIIKLEIKFKRKIRILLLIISILLLKSLIIIFL